MARKQDMNVNAEQLPNALLLETHEEKDAEQSLFLSA